MRSEVSERGLLEGTASEESDRARSNLRTPLGVLPALPAVDEDSFARRARGMLGHQDRVPEGGMQRAIPRECHELASRGVRARGGHLPSPGLRHTAASKRHGRARKAMVRVHVEPSGGKQLQRLLHNKSLRQIHKIERSSMEKKFKFENCPYWGVEFSPTTWEKAQSVREDESVRLRADVRLFLWRKGSARALDTHVNIVCEHGFTEENRGPHVPWAYISFCGRDW